MAPTLAIAQRGFVASILKLTLPFHLSAAVAGCAEADASRASEAKQSLTAAAPVGPLDNAPNNAVSDNAASIKADAALRRNYGAKDMKLHPCATLQSDGTIIGKGCPSSLVVFGPYVTVPSNADVQLRFDIEAPSLLTLTSDVLSEGAKRFHGALEDATLAPVEKHTVSYRIHVFEGVRSLETRIGLRNATPADFRLSNLRVTIQ